MVTRALAASVAALLLGGCDQFTRVEGTPLAPLARPLVVMHRGAGAGNLDYRENTLPAILYGAGIYDGAEMDLQLSHDGIIWLGHDNSVHDCNVPAGQSFNDPVSGGTSDDRCFQKLTDSEIAKVAYCDTATALPCGPTDESPTCVQRYVRLRDVFDRFSSDPALLPEILALDVKDQLCGSTGIPESRDMADALHALVTTYQMDWRLIVESDQRTFMDEFRSNGTPAYLFVEGYGEIDPIIADAAEAGANGISYRYTNAPFDPTIPEGLRNVGLRTMVFAVPDPYDNVEDIAPVWAMNPDVIATDRPDFYEHVVLPTPF